MILYIPISVAELLDKITILLIKQNSLNDPAKLVNVSNELRILNEIMEKNLIGNAEFDDLYRIMYEINKAGWDLEDKIRELMRNPRTDQEFIDTAFSIHDNNDKRAKHKLRINRSYGSAIIEEKSYKEIV
jgi:hypothetical protein